MYVLLSFADFFKNSFKIKVLSGSNSLDPDRARSGFKLFAFRLSADNTDR